MIYPSYLATQHYDRFNIKVLSVSSVEQISLDDARDHMRVTAFGSPPMSDEDEWITNNISAAREWCEGWSMCALVPQTLELGIAVFPGSYQYLTGVAASQRPGWFFEDVWRQNGILLPMAAPLVAVDSIKYYDNGGNIQTLDPSAYYVNDYERPAVAYPAPGTVWPVAQQMNRRAVIVRYRCGYQVTDNTASPATASNLPKSLRAAILLVLGHLHENREDAQEVVLTELPIGAKALMEHYRTRLGIA